MAGYTALQINEVEDQAPNIGLPAEMQFSGSACMKLDDDVIDVKPWTAVRVAPETMRSLEAGPEGAELVAIGAPNTGPGDGNNVLGCWSD
jgi:hypothetical protein